MPACQLSPHLSEPDGTKAMLLKITYQTGRWGWRSGDLEEFLSESKAFPKRQGVAFNYNLGFNGAAFQLQEPLLLESAVDLVSSRQRNALLIPRLPSSRHTSPKYSPEPQEDAS